MRAIASAPFAAVAAVVLFACLSLTAGPLRGEPIPAAPLPDDRASEPGYSSRLARFHEAETKARAMAARAKVAALVTPNMDLYDVTAYDLALTIDPNTSTVTGVGTTTALVTGTSLATMDLHLRPNLTVTGATAGGGAVSFSRVGEILTVTLDRTYTTGETVAVAVDYYGNPEDGAGYFGWDSYDGQPLIWSLSEPYGARHWWPCKDVNTDKADAVDVRATVPDGLIVASNGLLVSETVDGGWRTFHWHEQYPIATYLVSLAIHPYEQFSTWYTPQAGGDPMEIRHFVVADRLADAQSAYAITDEMIDAFAQGFGEYPFLEEKYGHAHFPWGGAMEHQTCTSISTYAYGQGIISHELAHQWFGDLITCATFHDIWLNEGFATWSEAYWREQSEGPDAYLDEMLAAVYWGPGTIYVENPDNFWEIFDYNLSYLKASWVVHMLRRALGDEDFFAGLALYRDRYGFGAATTAEFQSVMEEASGRDLEAFFEEWIYGEYYPIYRYSYANFPGGAATDTEYRVIVRVDQVQANTGIFTMPLTIRVSTFSSQQDFVVENDAAVEYYTFVTDGPVTGVEIDPEWSILREVQFAGVTAAPVPAATRARLLAPVPNPFNPVTTLRFLLPQSGPVRLEVFDISGRRVRLLLDEARAAGEHTATWDGRGDAGERVPSGAYFARLTTVAGGETRKLMLVK